MTWIKTRRYRIKIPQKYGSAETPIKMVIIGDLHNRKFGEGNSQLVDRIVSERPDLIFSVGDLTVTSPKKETHSEVGMRLIKRLSYECPLYCINGNHEYRAKLFPDTYYGVYEELKRNMNISNVTLLEDDRRKITVKGFTMNIYGLDLPIRYYAKFPKETISNDEIVERLGEAEEECFNILLAHNPMYFDNYAKWGADLTFSGHFHGGSVRLPLIGGVISPQLQLFPKYDCGMYERFRKKLIVTAGLGTHSCVPRINNPAEVTVVELY